jgi:hypothetical protein
MLGDIKSYIVFPIVEIISSLFFLYVSFLQNIDFNTFSQYHSKGLEFLSDPGA